MIHGKLIRLYEDRLELTDDLLKPLGFSPGADVSGFLYMKPEEKEWEHLSLNVDIGLTPIPYRLWPVVARISVYLLHQAGSLHELTKILESRHINILSANIVRFGHRYAQWDMVIDLSSFTDHNDEKMADKKQTLSYQLLRPIVDRLAQYIGDLDRARREPAEKNREDPTPRDHGVFLFRGFEDDEEPVQAKPIFLLSDRYHSIESSDGSSATELSFRGQCEDDFVRFFKPEWSFILTKAGLRQDLSGGLFNHCVGAFDSQSQTLRVAVIPESQRRYFSRFIVTYQREGGQEQGLHGTTQGVLRRLTSCFRDVNLWWMSNQTMENEDFFEKGQVRVLVGLPTTFQGSLEAEFERIRESILPSKKEGADQGGDREPELPPNISITGVVIKPLEAPRVLLARESKS